MSHAVLKEEKKIKDLTVKEFKRLVQESIAEDIEAWKETLEILADKNLMRQIRNAEAARKRGKKADFIPWERISPQREIMFGWTG